MVYLVFAGGAMRGSSNDFGKAVMLAEELTESVPRDDINILRVDGRWCSIDDKGGVHEVTNDQADFAPAPNPDQKGGR
jgi:hypothetical protein